MAENNKRRRVDDETKDQGSNTAPNFQIITPNPLIDVNQTLVFNQLPLLQNQQLLYSLPQVQGTANGQQYYLFIPANENVAGQSVVSLPVQKDNDKSEIIVNAKETSDETQINQVQQKDSMQYNSQVIEIQQPNEQLLFVKSENPKTNNKNSNLAWKSQLYRCEYKGCTEIFTSLHQKKLHLETHIFPESEEYKCSICNMVFKKAIDRNKHITTHSIVNTFKCKECQKSFPYYTSLIKHVESKLCSKTNPLKCSYCKVKFFNSNDIAKHHKLCLKKCEICATYICGEPAYNAHKRTCKK